MGRGIVTAVLHLFHACQTAHEEMAIVHIRVVVRFDCSFFTAYISASLHSVLGCTK